MEIFAKLFSSLLVFVYHCFDRIVIHGYLSGLSRPEQVVYFFRQVLKIPVVEKEVLSSRTNDYQNWVEAYARNHQIPIQWAEKGVRKENYVLPALRRMEKKNAYGVYFIFKSMEQGRTFRISMPKYPTQDPNYRILAHQRSRFTHYYFYIRDEVLGPILVRVASFFPFHATYWLNGHSFIERELTKAAIGFHKDDNAFLAVDDLTALQAAADRLSPAIIDMIHGYKLHETDDEAVFGLAFLNTIKYILAFKGSPFLRPVREPSTTTSRNAVEQSPAVLVYHQRSHHQAHA